MNIIFVIDDVKSDWWIDNNGTNEFHPSLISEFGKETGNKIVLFTSLEFLSNVSDSFNVAQTDAVEIALKITDADYFGRVYSSVFDRIVDDLTFSGDQYIEPSSHIGSNGIEELEISEMEFVSAEQLHRDQDIITYMFTFRVEAEATSFDYWGRDDETKEILLEPSGTHTFEGKINVEVTREAGMYLDFEADNGFETAKNVTGALQETSYQPLFDEEYEEPIEDAYSACPECGRKINFDNDGGNGFCIDCAPNH